MVNQPICIYEVFYALQGTVVAAEPVPTCMFASKSVGENLGDP